MKDGIIAAGVILAIVLGIVLSVNFQNPDINPYEPTYTFGGSGELTISLPNGEDITIHTELELEALSLEYMSREADIILTGTVKEILPSRWNSVDCKRPHESIDDFEWHDEIYTDVIISVDEYLKNELQEEEVTVRVLTGTVGNDTSTADYEASFQKGEKVFLYLIEDEWEYTKDLGPEHYFVLGSVQGKFTLTEDGKAIRPDMDTTLEDVMNILEKVE